MKKDLSSILIEKITNKSKLKGLPSEYINNKINKYFLTNPKELKILEEEINQDNFNPDKNKKVKIIVKKIREEIGLVYEIFLTSNFNKKDKILDNSNSPEKALDLLDLHKSTKERKEYYETIYAHIFKNYTPKYILDLGCGLNPIAYPILSQIIKTKPKYFAIDLNPKDMEFLNKYFQKFNISGEAKSYDLSDISFLEDKNLSKVDTVFAFKFFDSIESVEKNISLKILDKLKGKFIVISFPTKSVISRKEIKQNKRNWLRNYFEKNNLQYEEFEVENELFFILNLIHTS